MKHIYLLFIILGAAFQSKSQNLQSFDAKHPVKISGSVGGTSTFYGVSGISNRRTPFSYLLNGNVTFNILGIVKVPLSYMISEQDRKFQQPFNQVGFSPEYKWLKVHAGYRNLKWGEYSLAGYNFLMGGVEIQKEKYRAGFVYGRLNRKTSPDTLQYKNILPAYQRMGYSFKIGYGKANNFVDLVYFRAWDLRDSLHTPSNYENVQPQQNAVLDLITQQKFLKKFTFKAEVAVSGTNQNRNATNTTTLFADGIEKKVLKMNSSGIGGKALVSSLAYQNKGTSAEIGVKMQTLNFRSLGGYFYNTNLLNYYIRGNFGLLKEKLRMGLSLNMMDDNFGRQKQVTTTRFMPAITLDYNPNAIWGINGQYNLVRATQVIVNDTNASQSLKTNLLNQDNHTITLMPRYMLKKKTKTYMFMLMETYQWVADKNINTKQYSDMKTSMTNATCNLTFLPTGVSVNTALFMSHIKNAAINVSTYGLTMGSNKSFLKNKINSGGTLSISVNPMSVTTNFTAQGGYRPDKHQNIGLNISLINNAARGVSSGPSFKEIQLRISYMYSF